MSGCSSVGRASAFQAGCREFESRHPLQHIRAHVAQSVERFLGKEEVHRFDSGRGLHPANFKQRSTPLGALIG